MAKKNLSTEKTLSTEEKMIGSVSTFFKKNKVILIVICAVIVVGILAAIIAVNAVNSAKDKAQIKVAKLEQQYAEVLASDAQDWTALTADLQAMVKGSSYASVKSQYLLGLVYYQQQNYTEASDAFMKAYDLNKSIYLAPLSLANAAACAEEGGDSAKALELYNQIYNDYPQSGTAAKALFNVARMYYQQGNTQLAQATFAQVADYYPNSEYGKLAQNLANVL
jgi:tetratricopeptide (TPR) repeat protein